MAGLPSAIYFPYIDLDGDFAKGLLVYFRHIRLLQPRFSVPSPLTEEGEKRGWIIVDKPLEVNLDRRGAQRLLRDYESLGNLYHDSGYLAYLKHSGGHGSEVEPWHELLTELRGYGQLRPGPDELDTLRGQILLQMAQDLDRQRREIRDALEEANHVERSFLRAIGAEKEEDEGLEWTTNPLLATEEDDFLIPQRVKAWWEMLEALGEQPLPALFTDNKKAKGHLMLACMVNDQQEPSPSTLLLRVHLPIFAPPTLDEAGRIRQIVGDFLPWKIFCERLEDLLQKAYSISWSEEALRDIVTGGRALSAYFQESIPGPLQDRVSELQPPSHEEWRQGVLETFLFPGHVLDASLGRNRRGFHVNQCVVLFHIHDQ